MLTVGCRRLLAISLMCLALPYQVKSIKNNQALVFCPACQTVAQAKPVIFDLVPDLKIGDYVLLQNNRAVKQIPAEEAGEIFKMLA